MSVYIACDICGKSVMNPKLKGDIKEFEESEKLEGWLNMEKLDICPDCIKEYKRVMNK